MSERTLKLAIPIWVFLIVGMIAYPVLGGHERPRMDGEKARQKAALIAAGQINLRDATDLAEKEVSGTALQVACEIEPGLDARPERPVSQAANRLVYQVCCFAKEKVQAVRIDGLTRSVIDVREQK